MVFCYQNPIQESSVCKRSLNTLLYIEDLTEVIKTVYGRYLNGHLSMEDSISLKDRQSLIESSLRVINHLKTFEWYFVPRIPFKSLRPAKGHWRLFYLLKILEGSSVYKSFEESSLNRSLLKGIYSLLDVYTKVVERISLQIFSP